MGRSRKRRSGGPLSDQELRRYGLFLTVPLIILVLAGVLLAAGLIRERGHGPKSEPETVDNLDSIGEEQDVVIEPDTKEYHYNFGGSILERDAVPGINDLMEAYFRAELDCDVETLNSLLTSGDTSQAEAQRAELEALCQYVEGYGNISCYTLHGPAEDLYIAYTYYETKYFLADSWAPGLVNPYVQRQEDGSFKIYDEELTPEMEEFLEKAQVNEDVHLLISQVDRQLAQVLETDGELNAMVEYLKQGKTYETESQGE